MEPFAGFDDLGLLVARCLLSLVFAASAYDKFMAPPREIAMLSSLHLPFPRLLERGIGVFEAVGVASLVFGIYARPMSLLLGMFMLVVTVMFVRFWSEQGEKKSTDRNTFFANLSIVGGMSSRGDRWTRADGVHAVRQNAPLCRDAGRWLSSANASLIMS